MVANVFDSETNLYKHFLSTYIFLFNFSFTVLTSDPHSMEYELALNRERESGSGGKSGTTSVVQLRGLPFKCTREDIALFFQGTGKYHFLPLSETRGILQSNSCVCVSINTCL